MLSCCCCWWWWWCWRWWWWWRRWWWCGGSWCWGGGPIPRPRTILSASLRSRNALQHFTRATSYGILQKNAVAQNKGPHHTLCEPEQSKRTSTFRKSHFLRKFTGKMPCPKVSQNACKRVTKATLYRTLQEKCRGPEPSTTLCASLRSRNALQHFTRATLYGNLQEKCHAPEWPLCASLRSRNALQHFTRATLHGNLQVKGRRPEWAPWSSTGLYSYRKNPSVWTHCLGKKGLGPTLKSMDSTAQVS